MVYLIDLEPESASAGWLPAGKTWKDMNGPVKLMTTLSGLGRFYKKSIYAQAASEIVYRLDGKYKTFVAALGLGSNKRTSSVEFQVIVDGQEKYKSPLYRTGMPVIAVAVDVAGAKELKLVVTDGGDGITNDYAWWGEARLIKK
jgi:endo-alpha-N-acetylgalactosaminidase